MELEFVLQQRGIPYEKARIEPSFTIRDLAGRGGNTASSFAKSVLVKSHGTYALCVVPVGKKVDLNRVAACMGLGGVQLATESELSQVFRDCELGAEPPVGRLYGISTIMDRSLDVQESLSFKADHHGVAYKLRGKDYKALAEPVVADIARS